MEKYIQAETLIKDSLAQLDIEISSKQVEQLFMFYDMLIEKNKVMNLTGITEIRDVVLKHFVDSVSIVKVIDKSKFQEGISIIDIGTGAGFPGIPLKIIFPNINIVLLDSLNKRLVFINEVIEKLSLNGITTIHGRSEDIARKKEYRDEFDLCVSRAVANLSTLCELCLPFVKVNGHFISYKAGNPTQEIEEATFAIEKLGGKRESVVSFVLPDSDINRVFVNIKKCKSTSKAYPRKAGTPAKEPLVRNNK